MSDRAAGALAAAAAQAAQLEARLGRALPPAREPLEPLVSVSRLDAAACGRLRRALGDEPVLDEDARRRAAFGGGLGEALRRRAGVEDAVPDAVVAPTDEAATVRLLAAAEELQLGVVVRGRGTQVPTRDVPTASGRMALLALSTGRLAGAPRLDVEARTVTVGAGAALGELEQVLRGRGFTLGAPAGTPAARSVGGWLAGGGFDVEGPCPPDVLVAARVATPRGVLLADGGGPAAALLAASGGRMGVVVEATLRIRRRAPHATRRRLEAATLGEALARLRALAEDAPQGVAAALAEPPHGAPRARRPWRRTAGGAGAVVELRVEGDRTLGGLRRALALERGTPGSGDAALGAAPDPALCEALLDRGVGLGSIAARLPWSALAGLSDGVLRPLEAALEVHAGGGRAALRARGAGAEARVAVDLLYPVDPGLPVKPWLALRDAAVAALVRAGARVAPAHEDDAAVAGLAGAAWRAAADRLDPAAVLRRRRDP